MDGGGRGRRGGLLDTKQLSGHIYPLTQIQRGGRSTPSFPLRAVHVLLLTASDYLGLGHSVRYDGQPGAQTAALVAAYNTEAEPPPPSTPPVHNEAPQAAIVITNAERALTLRQHPFARARRQVASPDGRHPVAGAARGEPSAELQSQGSHQA